MAKENHQENNPDCTDVQPATWNQNNLIIRKICTFLGPKDLSCFREVCAKWKHESLPFWQYHRTRHTLHHYSELGLELKSSKALDDCIIPKLPLPDPLTIFKEYRPPEMECDFDCVGAEELCDFFSRARKEDAQLKDTSFLVIKLKQWNCFGRFPSEQQGAKWFLNEIADKVVHLTLDRCNLSISQNEFFPKLCQMTQLKKLTVRGTYFQLRPNFPVEPTLAEISPLWNLKALEMNYEKCTKKRMSNYNFPWNLFLEATPDLKAVIFSYSNWMNLAFANQQLSELVGILKQQQAIMPSDSMNLIIFKNLLGPNQDSVIMKNDVMNMVQGSLNNLGIKSSVQGPPYLPPYVLAHVYDLPLVIKFQGHQDDNVEPKGFKVLEIFSRGTL